MKYRIAEDALGFFWPQYQTWYGSWKSTEDRKTQTGCMPYLEDAAKRIEYHKLNRENGSIGHVAIKTFHKIV